MLPLRAIYQSIRFVRRILMRHFQTESDRWLSSYHNFRSVSRVPWLPISPYCLLQPPLRVLLVYTNSLYIVLFYSLNKTILLSALLVTLVLFVKCPTSTKYLPESRETFPLLLPRKSSWCLLTPSSEDLYIPTSSDIFRLPMLIPASFQCLVVVQRSALGELGCIRSLWVAPCEYACTPCLLNCVVSTWLHRVNSLSPRTGVYVLCTLLFGYIECSGCIRVQTIFFADIFVKKQDGSLRLYINYGGLNAWYKKGAIHSPSDRRSSGLAKYSQILYQANHQRPLPQHHNQRWRGRENSIQDRISTIRIYGHALCTSEHTCYTSKVDQLHTKLISRYLFFGVPQQHPDIFQQNDTIQKTC